MRREGRKDEREGRKEMDVGARRDRGGPCAGGRGVLEQGRHWWAHARQHLDRSAASDGKPQAAHLDRAGRRPAEPDRVGRLRAAGMGQAVRKADGLRGAREVRGLIRRNGRADAPGRGAVRPRVGVGRREPAPDSRRRREAGERRTGAGMEELHPAVAIACAQHGRRQALRDLAAVGAEHPPLQHEAGAPGADELERDLQRKVPRPDHGAEQSDPDRRCGAVPLEEGPEPRDQRSVRADGTAAERGGEVAQRTASADQEVLGARVG